MQCDPAARLRDPGHPKQIQKRAWMLMIRIDEPELELVRFRELIDKIGFPG